MLRVGRLESRMGDAFGPAEEGDLEEVDGAASNAWPPELNGLMGRIEAMEGRLGAPQGSRHRRSAAGLGRGSARQTSYVPQRDEELGQLRLQLFSLATQLAKTEEQLKSRSARRRGRPSTTRHPKWQFWRA